MKLGFVVNPIAGMGGKVGLKGTDGADILEKARKLGAKEEAGIKAKKALEELIDLKEDLEILTYPGNMGEDIVKELGFKYTLLKENLNTFGPENTKEATNRMYEEKIDLILFAGGDGTARDIYNIIETQIPAIGIPAGVKIHSAVYANHPRSAGEIASKYLKKQITRTKESEVMDIDEDAFRDGRVTAKLYGYMNVPVEKYLVQSLKAGRQEDDETVLKGIGSRIIKEMEKDTIYIIGSGTSPRYIMEQLNLPHTLLGIDLVKNKNLIASDVNEQEILEHIKGEKAKIVVTIIGGQGYIFGRGNQQLSSSVIKEVGIDNIIVIGTKDKIVSLGGQPLLVDTGDDKVNKKFNKYFKITIGNNEQMIYKVKGF